ncbi:Rib/alpha-like domain-containing protein, partial [Limosilactobacillus oris]|uniref:Rib/alpha-like domain-containing protein n=1 Tax=Limosilactobacillus oris TaxID=1632 RepID=UPI0018846D8A
MNKEFQTLRKKQRFGLRKLNIGVASVLLGFTIFGYNLVSQAPVAHAATSTVATSAGSGSSGSSATGGVSGSQASNSQAAGQATPATQVTVPAASQRSAPANSDNASSSTANQAGTVSANHTAIGTTPSSQTVSVNEITSSATQARTLMMNLAVIKPDTDTLPKSTQTYTLVSQPLLTDYINHLHDGKRDGNTWVDKNLYWFRDKTLNTIFGTTSKSKPGIITSHPDKYFFAAYVDYNSSYHRVILLARSQNPTDHNLYSYTIHTGIKQNTSSTIAAPNTDTQEVYGGASGSKYDLIFKNYQGKSYAVILKGFEHADGEYGMLPVFDGGLLDPTYGSNTYDQNDEAAKTKSIGSWASAIPQETSTKVRYVDQATGKDIVQPMEISGFGYQGFKVKGEAPTVKGYHVVSKPKFLGLAYEDGTIAPYKVGQTYDLALSDSVVIKQTVIDTDGTVRATAYYNGSPLSKSASRILGREGDNDQMSFVTPDDKFHTYTNRIGQVDDSYIYYYAKDSDPTGSEMRLHFIDVTGVNNSSYAPSDGPELDVDKVQTIHGNIGENYSFKYTVPTNYYEVGSSHVTGTYSGTRHDAYVYVKKQADDKGKYTVAAGKPVTLTHGQKVKAGDSLDSSAVILTDAKGQPVSLPDGAKVVWTTAPDTSEVKNDKTGQAKVVYGDQSESEPVTVTYNVTQNDADQYTPEVLTPTAKQNEDVDPNSVVTNKDNLPQGTTYSWKTKPDTSKAGQTATGSLHVAYPDGSSEDVTVKVNVQSNADQYTPEVLTPTAKQNEDVDPNSVVTNKDNLPQGTTYSWKTK